MFWRQIAARGKSRGPVPSSGMSIPLTPVNGSRLGKGVTAFPSVAAPSGQLRPLAALRLPAVHHGDVGTPLSQDGPYPTTLSARIERYEYSSRLPAIR